MQEVDRALIGGEGVTGDLLDRRGESGPLALVIQVGQQRQHLGVDAQRGGVVLAARPHARGPQRPAVRSGDDLHIAAVMLVLAHHGTSTRRSGRSARAVCSGARQRSVRIRIPSTVRCG